MAAIQWKRDGLQGNVSRPLEKKGCSIRYEPM